MIYLIVVSVLIVLSFFIALFNIIYEEIFRVQYEVNVEKGESVLKINNFNFNIDLILYYFKGTKGVDKIINSDNIINCNDIIENTDSCTTSSTDSACNLYNQFITQCDLYKKSFLLYGLKHDENIDLSDWEKLDFNLKIIIITLIILLPTLLFIIGLSQFYDTIVYLILKWLLLFICFICHIYVLAKVFLLKKDYENKKNEEIEAEIKNKLKEFLKFLCFENTPSSDTATTYTIEEITDCNAKINTLVDSVNIIPKYKFSTGSYLIGASLLFIVIASFLSYFINIVV